MQLTITNRSSQNFTVNYGTRPPRSQPFRTLSIPPGGQGTYVPNNASDPVVVSKNQVVGCDAADVNYVIADLARFGMVSDAQADGFNASRNPMAPLWSGLTYTVSN